MNVLNFPARDDSAPESVRAARRAIADSRLPVAD